MIVIGLDPGEKESAIVMWDGSTHQQIHSQILAEFR